ncbi:integral membrane protein [Methanosarcina siciliae C2J]|uniref:Integral membrane protein n=1 Tax=Methanosarcina siciliae C2J TaxID=1434118 RepID=A0A0E3PLJ8_9EURY|nr:DMT family transporter [Methanosarcina siciliae]AKB35309.1 integral membrane protein [Methanosarcina siciliae C2J]
MFLESKKAHLAVITGCVFYSMNGIFISNIHDMAISPVIFYRLFFGLLFLFIYIAARGKISDLRLKKKKKSLLLQGTLVVACMLLYFTCLKITCVSIAILLQYTAPIYVMLASPFLLKEKIGKESVAALFIAIMGVFLIVRPEGGLSGIELTGTYMLGMLSGLLSGVVFAALILNVRVLKTEYPELSIVFWPMGIALLLLSPFAFEVPPAVLYSNLKVLAAFGIISIGFGEIFTVLGLANIKAQTGSVLSLIEPVSGVFFDITVLGIALSSETLAGCALIIGSALIISLKDAEKLPEKRSEGMTPGFRKELSPQVHSGIPPKDSQ